MGSNKNQARMQAATATAAAVEGAMANANADEVLDADANVDDEQGVDIEHIAANMMPDTPIMLTYPGATSVSHAGVEWFVDESTGVCMVPADTATALIKEGLAFAADEE